MHKFKFACASESVTFLIVHEFDIVPRKGRRYHKTAQQLHSHQQEHIRLGKTTPLQSLDAVIAIHGKFRAIQKTLVLAPVHFYRNRDCHSYSKRRSQFHPYQAVNRNKLNQEIYQINFPLNFPCHQLFASTHSGRNSKMPASNSIGLETASASLETRNSRFENQLENIVTMHEPRNDQHTLRLAYVVRVLSNSATNFSW